MPSEFATRKEIVDQRLKGAGWDVFDRSQVVEEFFLGSDDSNGADNDTSREFSDYVLLGKNGKPVAVVEAKRSAKSAELGREQAKQYCQNIQGRFGGELPFCFYTNGHEIFFWNLGEDPPQKVHGFPTRQDLERLLFIRKYKKPLTDELINTAIAGRDFQLQAIRSVMEGLEKRRRRFLLVMATGTGKKIGAGHLATASTHLSGTTGGRFGYIPNAGWSRSRRLSFRNGGRAMPPLSG